MQLLPAVHYCLGTKSCMFSFFAAINIYLSIVITVDLPNVLKILKYDVFFYKQSSHSENGCTSLEGH